MIYCRNFEFQNFHKKITQKKNLKKIEKSFDQKSTKFSGAQIDLLKYIFPEFDSASMMGRCSIGCAKQNGKNDQKMSPEDTFGFRLSKCCC